MARDYIENMLKLKKIPDLYACLENNERYSVPYSVFMHFNPFGSSRTKCLFRHATSQTHALAYHTQSSIIIQ